MSEAISTNLPQVSDDLMRARSRMRTHYRLAEPEQLDRIAAALDPVRKVQSAINIRARQLVEGMRNSDHQGDPLDDFMNAYDLSTREGVALMCLAEALLRIPDADTANRLIRDKLGEGTWRRAGEEAGGMFVNASTWALIRVSCFGSALSIVSV